MSERRNAEPFYCAPRTKQLHQEHLDKINRSAFPRQYTYAGYLYIRSDANREWIRKYFVLNNNFLLCGNHPYAEILAGSIPLEGCNVGQRVKSSNITFEITTYSQSCPSKSEKAKKSKRRRRKRYYFRSDSPIMCSRWKEYIERASKLSIKDIYRLRYKLGNNINSESSKVIAAKHRITNKEFAIKIIDKRKCDQQKLQTSINILKQLKNVNIVEICDLFETRKYLYIIMEICKEGEILNKISSLNEGSYTVDQCINIIHQIAKGVKYMHSMGVICKDLKIENILCVGDMVKICNYGLSNTLIENKNNSKYVQIIKQKELMVFGFIRECQELLSYKINTFYVIPSCVISICFQYFGNSMNIDILSYPAPEILINDICDYHNTTVDFWSIGVILYMLICGYPPHGNNNLDEIAKSILNDDIQFDDENGWKYINDETKELIKGLLSRDPSQRKTCDHVLKIKQLSKFKCLSLHSVTKLAPELINRYSFIQ